MSTQPPLPIPGEQPWDDTLNAYLSALDARSTSLEERVAVLENQPQQRTGRYALNTTTTPPPASGQLRLDNTNQAAATLLYLHYVNQDGVDTANFWQAFGTIQSVYIQDRDDATKWIRFNSAGPRVDHGTYVEIPITLDSSSPLPIPSQQVTVVITS